MPAYSAISSDSWMMILLVFKWLDYLLSLKTLEFVQVGLHVNRITKDLACSRRQLVKQSERVTGAIVTREAWVGLQFELNFPNFFYPPATISQFTPNWTPRTSYQGLDSDTHGVLRLMSIPRQ